MLQAVTEHLIDLCEEDGRPIALIGVFSKRSHSLIENIAVLLDWQGKGIGGLLLKRAYEIARSLGVHELRLLHDCDVFREHLFSAHRGFPEFLREPQAAG